VRVAVARGRHLVALGHARVSHGKAVVTMHERRRATRGKWTITIVLSRPHRAASTTAMVVHIR
jgi:hypothetical protein